MRIGLFCRRFGVAIAPVLGARLSCPQSMTVLAGEMLHDGQLCSGSVGISGGSDLGPSKLLPPCGASSVMIGLSSESRRSLRTSGWVGWSAPVKDRGASHERLICSGLACSRTQDYAMKHLSTILRFRCPSCSSQKHGPRPGRRLKKAFSSYAYNFILLFFRKPDIQNLRSRHNRTLTRWQMEERQFWDPNYRGS